MITTLYRTLSATDLAIKKGHGAEPPVKENTKLAKNIEMFFCGQENEQIFVDVQNKKSFKLKMKHYNGTSTPLRVASIRKYVRQYDLQIGDRMILEKIESGADKKYLIGYLKKANAISIYEGKDDKGRVDGGKFHRIMKEQIDEGKVIETSVEEFRFVGKRQKNKGVFVVRYHDEEVSVEFNNIPIKFGAHKIYEMDFGKYPIELSEIQGWNIEKNAPQLYIRFEDNEYKDDDDSIIRNISENDIKEAKGTYSAVPVEKVALRENKKEIYPRKKSVSLNALKRANNTCEYNHNHSSFFRKKTNIKYMEPHHLIPLHYYDEFDWSLDVEANVVSLCSECHNRIHYGDGRRIIKKLWNKRHNELEDANIGVTEKQLLKYYGY